MKCDQPDKHFGFITPDEGGTDVFAHLNALLQSGIDGLREGQVEPDKRGRGMQAADVKLA